MNIVEITVDNFVATLLRDKLLQTALNRLAVKQFGFCLIKASGRQHPP
jgi:hypothetical protein